MSITFCLVFLIQKPHWVQPLGLRRFYCTAYPSLFSDSFNRRMHSLLNERSSFSDISSSAFSSHSGNRIVFTFFIFPPLYVICIHSSAYALIVNRYVTTIYPFRKQTFKSVGK